MKATTIFTSRSNTTEEHSTDPEQSGLTRKLVMRIRLDDMPTLPTNAYYRGPAPGWVPNYATVTEEFATGYGEDSSSHYRTVHVSGFLLKKDGTLGKLLYDDNWRSYSPPGVKGSLEEMPAALHEALAQVLPAFDKGILPA